MTCLGVLERGERGDDNGTCLKEGGLIEMSIYSAPFACRSFAWILTFVSKYFNIKNSDVKDKVPKALSIKVYNKVARSVIVRNRPRTANDWMILKNVQMQLPA